MAKKWGPSAEAVTNDKLHHTGRGFDNVTSITYGAYGPTQVVADGYTYNFTYTNGLFTKLTEVDGATPKQEWVVAYNANSQVTSITNNQLP